MATEFWMRRYIVAWNIMCIYIYITQTTGLLFCPQILSKKSQNVSVWFTLFMHHVKKWRSNINKVSSLQVVPRHTSRLLKRVPTDTRSSGAEIVTQWKHLSNGWNCQWPAQIQRLLFNCKYIVRHTLVSN